MKIGIFTNAYKPMISGVVNSIDLIKKGLSSAGHKVYIFAPKFAEYRDSEAGVFRFESVNLTKNMKYPLAIPYSPKIFGYIKRIGLDLVHCHHPFLLGEVGADFAKKLNIPLVYTFHTQYEQYSHYVPLPQKFVKRFTRKSVVKYADKCDQIICPSPTIVELLKKYGITAPVKMLPNAIDLDKFKSCDSGRVREKYGIGKDEKLLIYVGRIGQEKNLEFMLRSFKKAIEKYPAKLMIVGEGPEQEQIQEESKEMGLEEFVIFPGRVEYKEIPDYYAAGYAFVMTSTTEVKPLALLEAMASGLPVVAVAAAGSSDTVNQGVDGILTNLDSGNYTFALEKILSDRDLRNRLSEGALATSEQYSIKTISSQLEDIYSRLIAEKSRKVLR